MLLVSASTPYCLDGVRWKLKPGEGSQCKNLRTDTAEVQSKSHADLLFEENVDDKVGPKKARNTQGQMHSLV